MKRYVLSVLMSVLTVVAVSSQVNSHSSEGYIARGILMYDDCNFRGCIDQMSKAVRQTLSPEEKEEADYYVAMSSLQCGDESAIDLITGFLRDYPSSVRRAEMEKAEGDYYFNRHIYGKALTAYGRVDSRQLDGSDAEDYVYRSAYGNMKLAEYDKANDGFSSLTSTKRYGNASRFYQGYIAYATGDYAAAEPLLSAVDKSSSPGDMAEYYLCQIYFSRENYGKALPLARSLASRNVDVEYRAEALRIAGESLFNMGREKEAAESLYDYVSMCDRPQLSAMYVLGVCEYRDGDYGKAIEHLSQAVASDDKTGQNAYLLLGQSHYRQGNKTAALLALETASLMGHDPEAKESAAYNYVVVKSQDRNTGFAGCVESAETFLMQYPESDYADNVREYLVKGYMANNNYERALLCMASSENMTPSLLECKQRTLFTLATRDADAGRVKQALTRFGQAKAIPVSDKTVAVECDLWIGDCYYKESRYDAAASSYLEYLNNITPSHVNCVTAYYNLGYCRFQQKRYDDAFVNFKRVTQSPGNLSKSHVADAYNRMGDCRYYESDFDQASRYYDQAIKVNPSSGDYALFQNALMRGHNRDYENKIKDLDALIAGYPSSSLVPLAMLEKAESYTALDDSDNAIETYMQLAEKYPSTSQARNALLQLAIAYGNSGDRNKAIEIYKEVIKDYPDSEEAGVAADDLKRVLAEEGRLDEYAGFVKTVPNAPQIDAGEMDMLSFSAAENAYLGGNGIKALTEYLSQYPDGQYRHKALHYLTQASFEGGNEGQALVYANEILTDYPQSDVAEQALSIKADIEYRQGNVQNALEDYRQLEQMAVVAHNVRAARVGQLRTLRDMGMHEDVVKTADKLVASLDVDDVVMNEVLFSRAYALNALERYSEAVADWMALSQHTEDIYGAKSAYYMAQYYYDAEMPDKSREVVEKLIESDSPHQYWLARAFILLSDINRKEGREFEADEYLKTLRETYPGTETDIFIMIDQRLNR